MKNGKVNSVYSEDKKDLLKEAKKEIRDRHDKAVQNSYLILGLIILFISIISLFIISGNINIKWIVSITLLFLSIYLFILFIHQKRTIKYDILFPQLVELLFVSYHDFIKNNLLMLPYSTFNEKHLKLYNLFYKKLQSGVDRQTYASVVNDIISIEPETIKSIDIVKHCSDLFRDFHTKLVSSIQQEYLSNSVEINALSSLDLQSKYLNDLIEVVKPYTTQFEQIVKTRDALLNQFNRFKEVMNESLLTSAGKGFLEGITFSFLDLHSDNANFINKFDNILFYYVTQWDNIATVIHNSIITLNRKTYDEAIKYSINQMKPLFHEFYNQNISLLPLLNQLNHGLK